MDDKIKEMMTNKATLNQKIKDLEKESAKKLKDRETELNK